MAPDEHWYQMRFRAPHGRTEVLWVEQQPNDKYRVMNVPVWVYGISVGSLVDGPQGPNGVLEYRELLEPSPGGTVRYIVPDGAVASRLYLNRVGPEATSRGIGIGPATFLDPLIVSVHLHRRDQWNPAFASYLNELVEEGAIEQWEVGDPDEYADDYQDETKGDESSHDEASELIHPQPTTAREHFFRL
jgi:hypothetical protein